jgi:hypothetical protein
MVQASPRNKCETLFKKFIKQEELGTLPHKPKSKVKPQNHQKKKNRRRRKENVGSLNTFVVFVRY